MRIAQVNPAGRGRAGRGGGRRAAAEPVDRGRAGALGRARRGRRRRRGEQPAAGQRGHGRRRRAEPPYRPGGRPKSHGSIAYCVRPAGGPQSSVPQARRRRPREASQGASVPGGAGKLDADDRGEVLQALLQPGQLRVARVADLVPDVVGEVQGQRVLAGSARDTRPARCEQAARAFSMTEAGVFGWNCTTASCLPNARSKAAQPAAARAQRRGDRRDRQEPRRVRYVHGCQLRARSRPAAPGSHRGTGPQAMANGARAARAAGPAGTVDRQKAECAPAPGTGPARPGTASAPAVSGRAPVAGLIEDYALIGDMQTAALVGKDGSIDWLCLPRFDSPACFTRLLGTDDHGYWRIGPAGQRRRSAEVARHYQGDTLILQTEWRTATGTVRAGRLHAAAGRQAAGAGPDRGGRPRARGHGVHAADAARLRRDPPLGAARGRPDLRGRRAGLAVAGHAGHPDRPQHGPPRGVPGGRGRARAVRADLAALPRGRRPSGPTPPPS